MSRDAMLSIDTIKKIEAGQPVSDRAYTRIMTVLRPGVIARFYRGSMRMLNEHSDDELRAELDRRARYRASGGTEPCHTTTEMKEKDNDTVG